MKRLYSKHGDVLTFRFHAPGFPQVAIDELATEVARAQEPSDFHPEARLIMQDDEHAPWEQAHVYEMFKGRKLRSFVHLSEACAFARGQVGTLPDDAPVMIVVGIGVAPSQLDGDELPPGFVMFDRLTPAPPQTRTLDADQLEALTLFAKQHGRGWKEQLRYCWETGNWGVTDRTAELQQVRNIFGPSWLVRFSFKNPVTHKELP